MIYIYALIDPRTTAVRYIGKSTRPRQRLANHCNERTSTWRNRWIQQLGRLGLRPVLAICEVLTDDGDWKAAERKWIAQAKAWGWRLTNCTSGGDGVHDLPAESLARRNATWVGRKHRPESLAKIGIASRGRTHSKASRDGMRVKMTGRTIAWVDKVSQSLCKLTADQVSDVHRLLASGYRQYELATMFHVHKSTISNIHRHKGYIWMKS